MRKRTKEETQNLVLSLQVLKENESVKSWLKIVKEIKEIISANSYLAKNGDEALKSVGMLRGLDIAINLDDFVSNWK